MNADIIAKISEALQKTFDPTTSQSVRLECHEFLENVKQLPNSVQIGSEICRDFTSGNLATFLKNYGLLLIEETVKYRWNLMDDSSKQDIKRELESLFCIFVNDPQASKLKFSQIFAKVAIREWPQQWKFFTDILLGAYNLQIAGDSSISNAFCLVCMIFSDLCDAVFVDANSLGYFYIEDERKQEIIRALGVIAEKFIPAVVNNFIFIVTEQSNNTLSTFNEPLCKAILRLFNSSFNYFPSDIFFVSDAFLAALFTLIQKNLANNIILGLSAEFVEIICSKIYETESNSHLMFFFSELNSIFQLLTLLCSGDSFQKGIFLIISYSLVELGIKQICNAKFPLKNIPVEKYIEFLFSLCQVEIIQTQAVVSSFWVAMLNNAHWSKNNSLMQSISTQLIGLISSFFCMDHKKYFEKSSNFVQNELSVLDFDRLYSKVHSYYAEIVQAIGKKFPEEICNFCLPPILELLSQQIWNRLSESKMSSLLIIFENIVKGFIQLDKHEFNLENNSQFFTYTLSQLCSFSFTEAESIYFQLYAISNCLRFIIYFNVDFPFGSLYTKLFHMIYEFQDCNSFYKTRVKEKLFQILHSISFKITPSDAKTFVQYGLEISNSGYVYPEMNTILIDFLFEISTNASNSIEQKHLNDIFQLVFAHIQYSSQKLSFNLTPKQFLSLIGIYLACKKYYNANRKLKGIKFLEGDLQPCSELLSNLSKIISFVSRISRKKAILSSTFVYECIHSFIFSLIELVKFLHSLSQCDVELQELSIFSMPFYTKILQADTFALREQTSESTLESYFNRFSNWYESARKAAYSLLTICMEFDFFFSDSNIQNAIMSCLEDIVGFDSYAIYSLLDGLIDNFIKKAPTETLILMFNFKICQFLIYATEKCISFQSTADDDIEGIYQKISNDCCKKIIKVWQKALERLPTAVFNNYLETCIKVALLFLKFKSENVTKHSFEFLLFLAEKFKQNGEIFSTFVVNYYATFMQSMIENVKDFDDESFRNSLFILIAAFAIECYDVVNFFTWIGRENESLIINGRRRFLEKSTVRGRRDVIKDVLKSCFDCRKVERSESVYKVKNLTEKLIIHQQEKGALEQENEDYNLSFLFE